MVKTSTTIRLSEFASIVMNQFRDKKFINEDSLKFEDWERIDDELNSKVPQL